MKLELLLQKCHTMHWERLPASILSNNFWKTGINLQMLSRKLSNRKSMLGDFTSKISSSKVNPFVYIRPYIKWRDKKKPAISCYSKKSFRSEHHQCTSRCGGGQNAQINVINFEHELGYANSLSWNGPGNHIIRRSKVNIRQPKRKIMKNSDFKI